MANPVDAAFLDELAKALPARVFREVEPRYLEEPRGKWTGQAAAVVAPETTEQVSAVMRMAYAAGVGVVPYGGGTGSANGHLDPEGRHVVLSLEKLTDIRRTSAKDNSITVEAGVTLSAIQQAAQDVDRLFGLSLASEGSCTIGGNLATLPTGLDYWVNLKDMLSLQIYLVGKEKQLRIEVKNLLNLFGLLLNGLSKRVFFLLSFLMPMKILTPY